MHHRNPRDYIPDIRDGLSQRERIVLQCLHALAAGTRGKTCAYGHALWDCG